MSDGTRTRERAYQIWEQEGRPEGRELEHWLQAERDLPEGLDAEAAMAGAGSGLAQGDEAEVTAAAAAQSEHEGMDAEQAVQDLSAGNDLAAAKPDSP